MFRVCKRSCIAFVAIMLTVVYSVSARGASDPSFPDKLTRPSAHSVDLPEVSSGVAGDESLRIVVDPKSYIANEPPAATESTSGVQVVLKRKFQKERVYLQSANIIPAKIPHPAYSWKTRNPFEISYVNGFTGVFTAGKPIEFLVEGHSPVEIEVVPNEGFRLTATIFDEPRTMSFDTAHGEYDEKKQAWVITIEAPDDVAKSYVMEIFLYCAIDESRCAEIYGQAAQTSKALQFELQSE